MGVVLLAAECLGGVVDAGGVGAGVDGGVVALHEPLELPAVGDGDAAEVCPLAEVAEPLCCLAGGRAGQVLVVVFVDEGQQVLAAGQGLLGFDFGAEPGIGCA